MSCQEILTTHITSFNSFMPVAIGHKQVNIPSAKGSVLEFQKSKRLSWKRTAGMQLEQSLCRKLQQKRLWDSGKNI